MIVISAIRVLNFSGKEDEWPSWSEKCLAKAKSSGINDVLLRKVQILLDFVDEKTKEGKKQLKIIDLNELAYT
jgi:hypothetical protein